MGRGRGGPAEIFPRFYFCAQQLWDMRGVLVDPGAAQGQPSKCLWEGRRDYWPTCKHQGLSSWYCISTCGISKGHTLKQLLSLFASQFEMNLFLTKDNISDWFYIFIELTCRMKKRVVWHPSTVSQTFGLFHSHLRSFGVVHRVHGSVTLVVLMMPL